MYVLDKSGVNNITSENFEVKLSYSKNLGTNMCEICKKMQLSTFYEFGEVFCHHVNFNVYPVSHL